MAQNDQAIMTSFHAESRWLEINAAIVISEVLPLRIETPVGVRDEDPQLIQTEAIPDPLSPIYVEVFHPSILVRFPNLISVIVRGTQMNRIAQNSFERCGDIQNINLGNNYIQELPVGAFRNCRSLNTINLSGNRISTIDPLAFQGLPNIQSLDLSYNQFTAINAGWFAHFIALRSLSMKNNPLSGLEPGILRPNLVYLDLERCGLTQLYEDVFRNFTQLSYLNLASNPITTLPIGVFSDLVNIDYLILRSTNIRRLNSNSFGRHNNVTLFSIESSGLDEIQPGFFDNFGTLQRFHGIGNLCVNTTLEDIHLIDFDENRTFHQCFANWFVPRP